MTQDEWNINIDKLNGPNRDKWPNLHDEVYIANSNEIACVVYSITEIRMGWNAGKIAVYTNSKKPKLIFNPTTFLASGYDKHAVFSNNSQYLFIKITMYNKEKNIVFLPILVIEFKSNKFSLIYLDNGFHYEVEESETGRFFLKELYRDERFHSHNNEEIILNSMTWVSLKKIKTIKTMLVKNHNN